MASRYPENPLDELQKEFDLDSVDGFKSFLSKAFSLYSCVSGKREHDDEAEEQIQDFPDSKEKEKKVGAPEFDWDDNTYDFSHRKRGLAIIINNEDFRRSRCKSKKFEDRPGSSYDASSLYRSFEFLGFNVIPFHDLTAKRMIEVFRYAAVQYNHTNSDCFVCAILTHGDQTIAQKEWDRRGTDVRLDLLYGSDGIAISTKAIVEMFNDVYCPTLIDKPRMFFLQACRGEKLDPGLTVLVEKPLPTYSMHQGQGEQKYTKGSKQGEDPKPQKNDQQKSLSSSVDPPQFRTSDATDAAGDDESGENSDDDSESPSPISDIPVTPAPLFKDFLIMYATPPGHFAWRRTSGTWFIQSLCQVIDSNLLQSTPLLSALTQVSGIVARKYESKIPSKRHMHKKKQVPVIESMLVKDVFIPGRPKARKR